MASVGLRELKNHLRDFVEAAERGEEVVVTRRGEPIARIIRARSEELSDR